MSAIETPKTGRAARRRDYLTLAAFILGTLVAGANAVAVRFSNAELPPFWGATMRLGLAALVFWVLVLARRTPLPRGRTARGAILYGVLNFGMALGLTYWGFVRVGAGLGQVILALVPLLTFFFAAAQGLEPFRWRGLFGALLAVGGIALAFFEQPQGQVPLLSVLAMVAGAASIAASVVVVKRFPKGDPLATNAVAMTVGAAMVFALSIIAGEARQLPARPETWYAVLYLAVPGTVVVFSLFLYIIKNWPASRASYQLVFLPFVTVAVAAALLGETVTPIFAVGGALVLAGVWIGAFSKPKSETDCVDPQPGATASPGSVLADAARPCS